MLRFFCLIVLLSASFSVSARDVLVESPWVREAPPNAKALAGYVLITNVGKNTQELVAVSSPVFERVEFHVTTFDGGMMRMKHLETLVLKSGELAEFEPGGRHLMLINPKKKLKDGDKVPMTVTLKNGATISFDMQVRR